MNNVEFLIQKEGDRAWLPLESPTVEVLEGRYHLIAKNSHGEAPAQIQIRHRYTQDGVLQEELEKKLLKPDAQGQLQILDSAYLGYGLWTISCTPISIGGELDTNMTTSAAINLQVLEEDFDLISDWEFTETTQSFSNESLLSFPFPEVQVSPSGPELSPAAESVMGQNRPLESLNDSDGLHDADDLSPEPEISLNKREPMMLVNPVEESPSTDAIAPPPACLEENLATAEPTEEDTNWLTTALTIDEGTDWLTAELAEAGVSKSEDPAVVVDAMAASEPSRDASTWTVNLPTLPLTTVKMDLRPSQSSPLPPALSVAASALPVTDPQLPTFSRPSKWQSVSVEKLSAACRTYGTKPNTESDRAFAALDLQQRFSQTLTKLAIHHRQTAYADAAATFDQTTADCTQAVG